MADTIEQIKAMGFDRHMSVVANAGSGKTRVLVKRFVNMLLYHNIFLKNTPRLKASEIVAITFTRKAAAEMRSKVIKMFESEIGRCRERDKLEKLYRIREELSNARIATIHSFCSALLREFPIEAEVNPSFTDITAAHLDRIKRDSILSALEDRLESDNNEVRNQTERLLLVFGRREIERLIQTLLSKIELFEILKLFYSNPDLDIKRQANITFSEKYLPGISKNVEDIKEIFKSNYNNLGTKQQEQIDGFLASAEGLLVLAKERALPDTDRLLKIRSHFEEIREQVFTKTGTVLSKIKKNTLDCRTVEKIELLWRRCTGLFPFFESLGVSGYENEDTETARALISITEDVIERIDDEKADLTALDFGDMILKVYRLLDNPVAAEKIRKKIKFLLVDEFQDTDNLQYSIITKLLPELRGNGLQPGGAMPGLFIVGDPKQSIYGFRNADVRVFRKAACDIEKLNKILLEKGIIPAQMSSFTAAGEDTPDLVKLDYTREEIEGRLALTSTFRLRPVIAAFINKICCKIMNEDESEFEVGYSEFVCGRDVYDEALKPANNKGRIALILSIDKKKDNIPGSSGDDENNGAGDNSAQSEAGLVAAHIASIVASGMLIEVEGAVREISYRDIAVLARTRNRMQPLENELLKLGIPYVMHSGRGFLQSQEVKDIIAFLNFLITPPDSISLAAILRSPFFHFPDTLLFAVSQHKSGKSLWEKLNSYWEQNSNAQVGSEALAGGYMVLLQRALSILHEMLAEFPSMPVAHVINEILLKTARYGTIRDENKREIIEGNINRLLEMARDFDKRSFSGFFDFVDELNFMVNYGIGEAETAEITDADSVNIMTIHASKGLEFPVVYLYDSNHKSGRRDDFFISENLGFQFKSRIIKTGGNGAKVAVQAETPAYILAKYEYEEKQFAEEKRLLYVALSRAKDYLFISGTLTTSQIEKGSAGAFLGYILKSLEVLPLSNIASPILIEQEIALYIDGRIYRKSIEYEIEIITETGNRHFIDAAKKKELSQRMNLLDGLDISLGGDTYSPSSISQYLSDSENYLKKYILRFEDEENIAVIKDDDSLSDDETESAGPAAGTVIHSVMEKVNEWCDASGTADHDILGRIIDETISALRIGSGKKKLRTRAFTECQNVIKTHLIKKYFNELSIARREWELNMPIGDDFLKCIIDAAPIIGGEAEIWDWKTNRVDTQEERLELVNHYELQMKTYCFLLSKLFAGQTAYRARLLFTRMANEDTEDEKWTYVYSWTEAELSGYGIELEGYIQKIKSEYFK